MRGTREYTSVAQEQPLFKPLFSSGHPAGQNTSKGQIQPHVAHLLPLAYAGASRHTEGLRTDYLIEEVDECPPI